MSNKWIGKKDDSLTDIIKYYYEQRKLNFPSFDDAMKFMHTEVAEVYEIDLSRKSWVRNHPENKPSFSKERLAEELGDAIMMLVVAGLAEDVDPIAALELKIQSKLASTRRTITGNSQINLISEEELTKFLEEENDNK